jgi:hypothetical protein
MELCGADHFHYACFDTGGSIDEFADDVGMAVEARLFLDHVCVHRSQVYCVGLVTACLIKGALGDTSAPPPQERHAVTLPGSRTHSQGVDGPILPAGLRTKLTRSRCGRTGQRLGYGSCPLTTR